MLSLLSQSFKHLWRTRLFQFVAVFCFAVQFLVVWYARDIKIAYMGQVYFQSKLGALELLFASLFLQLFVGTFFAMMFGLWTAPYLHQGQRAGLTYSMPVARWKFVLSYVLMMLTVLSVLYADVLVVHWIIMGKKVFSTAGFWSLFFKGVLWESTAFVVLMLGFATGALWVGSLGSAFIGNVVIFLLQVAAFFIRPTIIPFVLGEAWGNWVVRLYRLFPPFGEITFDLWYTFHGQPVGTGRMLSWLIWFGIFYGLFALRLRYPKLSSLSS